MSKYDELVLRFEYKTMPIVFIRLETEGGITKTLKISQTEPEFLSHMCAVEEA